MVADKTRTGLKHQQQHVHSALNATLATVKLLRLAGSRQKVKHAQLDNILVLYLLHDVGLGQERVRVHLVLLGRLYCHRHRHRRWAAATAAAATALGVPAGL